MDKSVAQNVAKNWCWYGNMH